MMRLRITDDRGRKWTLCPIADVLDVVPQDRREILERAQAVSTVGAVRLAVIGLLAFMPLLVLAVVQGRFAGFMVQPNSLLAMAFLAPLPVIWLWLRAREGGRRAGQAADLLALLHRCAACGYDLSATGAQRDGCTVCPECGAAWRVGGEANAQRAQRVRQFKARGQPSKTTDARGRTVPLVSAGPESERSARGGPRTRVATPRLAWLGLAFMASPGFLIWLAKPSLSGPHVGLDGLVVLLTSLVCVFAGIGIFVSTTHRAAAAARTRQVLSRGHCPSCLHELGGLTAEEDGCTTCPECSAAWRLPPAPQKPPEARP